MHLLSADPVLSPKIDLPQELGSNTQLLIENNSFKGKPAIIWGSESDTWSAIWEANHKYPNISFDLLYELGKCESGLKQNKYGDSGKAYGIFQWWQSSWNLYNKKFGTELDRNNVYHQAEMTARVLNEGGYRNWLNCFKRTVLADLMSN